MIYQSAILVSFSLFLTYLGASRTLKGALGLSTLINLNRSATGAVVIASITALPELTSSIAAIYMGSSNLAMGNILGSNIYNLPLLIGLAGLVGEFEITNHVAEQCIMLVVINLIVAGVTIVSGTISPSLSVLLLGFYVLFLYRQLKKGEECEQETCSISDATLTLVTGGAALIIGSFILVNNAVGIMNAYSISPFIVGVVMSLGAVLPEVAVSLFSAVKGEHEISVGNIIGDNVITITLVLGIVSLMRPIQVAASEIITTIPFTIGFTAIIYLMHIKGWKVTKGTAALFLLSAIIILVYQMVSA
ncbi:MAG: sodium:calcium antiporter [bacterium]